MSSGRLMTLIAGMPARLTPVKLQALVLEPLLQRVLAERIADGELDFLEGEIVGIVVSDIGLHWYLTMREGRVRLISQGRPAVTIAGGVREFLLLVSRYEDPDTLFFERRLLVEGDTELGLLVKNLLDSIELDELPPPLRHMVIRAASLVHKTEGAPA